MQTAIPEPIRQTPQGEEAESILRACVHCGFCNATCPTYQQLGDERDGPRGRIYLIKQALEGQAVSRTTQVHLDRCLTCLACETTCPSGVDYRRLVDIGRELVEARVKRPLSERLARRSLRLLLAHPGRFTPLLRLGQALRPLLPAGLARHIPARQTAQPWPAGSRARRMLVLEGCVQPGIAPGINAAAARVLDTLGISLESAPEAGCCGALSQHLSAPEEALAFARRNIDAWWPAIEAGAEAIVITASGCGTQVKAYGQLLARDPAYAKRAARVSQLAKDVAEVLAQEDLSRLRLRPRRVAFHAPCSLQHGQRLGGVVEALLTRLGFALTPVSDAHLCCGSAGTYSLLQRTLSRRLLADKITALEAGSPEVIATANIGCLTHLQTQAAVPVRHWIELLEPALD